ncbi:MAG: UvrD-helicase domain-containing protein, partial [Thiotrichales bacterium]|nr:UvrD-helicase domain-containing protein [Thiotrichales bacterium]
MSREVQDQVQRQQAISAEGSFIVRAPAGSGKTELLVQRFLRLLSLVDAPEEIVAITFTRKAAAEMQSRILGALERAATTEEPETNHERQNWHLARAVLKRDTQLNWQIRQNPARLKIQTIDSLCAALTRQMPLLSGLGALPETIEDASPLFEQAAINTLNDLDQDSSWSDSIACLLEHMDNDLPRVKRLIMAMLGKRDQWLPHVVHDHQRPDLESALQHAISDSLSRSRQMIPQQLEAELCEVASFAALNLEASSPDHPTANCRFITELPGSEPEDQPAWLGLSELLLTKKGEWRRSHQVRDGFPRPADNKAEKEVREAMKTRARGVIDRLRAVPGLLQLLTDIRNLPPPAYTDSEWQVVGALCNVLKLAAIHLDVLFSETNRMDFIGIARAAQDSLGSETSPTELALVLDYQIRHLLVDEFQDISVNQADLLRKLTAGWTVEDGHSLFLVGDPMQSIYRFREAEVGIFLNTWEQQRLGQVPLTPVQIHTNFRSQPGLVEWVNNTFEQLMPPIEDIQTGAVSFETSTPYRNIQPIHSVSCYPDFNAGGTVEAERLVNTITTLRDNEPGSSIAVLVRSRRQLRDIIPTLRLAQLPFQAVDIETLGDRPEVRDLVALIRAMSHLADRTAWLALLRAPWCGLKLDALMSLVGMHRDRTVWECINDPQLTGQLDADARGRLEKFTLLMSQALDQLRQEGLHRSVESAWVKLGGPAFLTGDHELENVITVLETLAGAGQGGQLEDMAAFIDDVNALYSQPQAATGNPVQLLTIHKAKGLEFDHVL